MLCSAWLTLVASGKTASHYNSSSQSSCGSIFITFVTALLLWTRSHQHRGKNRDAKFPASKSWTHKCLEAKKSSKTIECCLLPSTAAPPGPGACRQALLFIMTTFCLLKWENGYDEATSFIWFYQSFKTRVGYFLNLPKKKVWKFSNYKREQRLEFYKSKNFWIFTNLRINNNKV